MKIPAVKSLVKIRTKYHHGSRMIPAQPSFNEYVGEVISPYKWLTDREFCITGNSEFPIRVINLDMVEDITMIHGSFNQIDAKMKVFTITGSKGNLYTVTRNSKGWNCDCPGFQFRKHCRHIVEAGKLQ